MGDNFKDYSSFACLCPFFWWGSTSKSWNKAASRLRKYCTVWFLLVEYHVTSIFDTSSTAPVWRQWGHVRPALHICGIDRSIEVSWNGSNGTAESSIRKLEKLVESVTNCMLHGCGLAKQTAASWTLCYHLRWQDVLSGKPSGCSKSWQWNRVNTEKWLVVSARILRGKSLKPQIENIVDRKPLNINWMISALLTMPNWSPPPSEFLRCAWEWSVTENFVRWNVINLTVKRLLWASSSGAASSKSWTPRD